MLWFLLWTALVAAALVTWLLLGRRLWRKSVALGREVSLADERRQTLERVNSELRERTAGAAPSGPSGPSQAPVRYGSTRRPATRSDGFDTRRRGRRRHYASSTR